MSSPAQRLKIDNPRLAALELQQATALLVAQDCRIFVLLAAIEGDVDRAGAQRGAVEAYRSTGVEVALTEMWDGHFDQYLDEARAGAPDSLWNEVWIRARKLSLDQAARYAAESSPLFRQLVA